MNKNDGKKKKNEKGAAKRVAFDAVFAAAAIVLSLLETVFDGFFTAVPGCKIGLANLAVMFAALFFGFADGLFVTLVKSGFVFLTRGAASFFMSVSGGMLSLAALTAAILIARKAKAELAYIGVSALCAALHNIGQLAAASVYTGTNLISAYLPLSAALGVVSGTATGIVIAVAMPVLTRSGLYNMKT